MTIRSTGLAVLTMLGFIAAAAAHAGTVDFLTGSEASLRSCQASYKSNVASENLRNLMGRFAREDAAATGQPLSADGARLPASNDDLVPKDCIADSKERLMPDAKDFIASFKQERIRSKARATAAQWLTAMDAIGSPIADQEAAKFSTLVNELRFEK